MRLLLIVLLAILLIGALPVWPYAAGWGVGYYPSGVFGLLLLVVLFLGLFGPAQRIP